jgi:hypothetical protein
MRALSGHYNGVVGVVTAGTIRILGVFGKNFLAVGYGFLAASAGGCRGGSPVLSAGGFAYCSIRAITRATVAGCHSPPRADLMPRALRAAAIPTSVSTPDARMLSINGITFSA